MSSAVNKSDARYSWKETFVLITTVNTWIGCLPSSEPTTGRGEDSTWPSYPPALRWTVHMSPECVRYTFLEPAYLCVYCIIFIQVFMLTTIRNFWGFPRCLGKKCAGLPVHFSCLENRHKELFDEVLWSWCGKNAGFCQFWKMKPVLLFVIHCRVKTQRSFNISEVSFLLTGGGWKVCEIYILKKTWKE